MKQKMLTLNLIYAILSTLADHDKTPPRLEDMCADERDLCLCYAMLYEEGLVRGVNPNVRSCCINPTNPRITLKGLEYLEGNEQMKKRAQVFTNVIHIAKP